MNYLFLDALHYQCHALRIKPKGLALQYAIEDLTYHFVARLYITRMGQMAPHIA